MRVVRSCGYSMQVAASDVLRTREIYDIPIAFSRKNTSPAMSSYGYVITTSKFTAVNEAMADQLRPTLYPDAALPSRADFPFEQRNRSPSFVPNPISAPERTYSSTTTTKKRSARDMCKDDADLRQSRRRRLSKEPLPDASLACPFAKHNPITSPGCWNFAAENLARLK